MPNWKQQFDIIWDKAKTILADQGTVISQAKLEKFLGVTTGKVQNWKRGQRPSAEDLQKIAEKLGLSPHWLLTGQGKPEDQADTTREDDRLYHGDRKRLAEMLARGEAANIVVEPDSLTAKVFFLESEYMDQGVTRLDILHMIKTWIDAQVRNAEDAHALDQDRRETKRDLDRAAVKPTEPERDPREQPPPPGTRPKGQP